MVTKVGISAEILHEAGNGNCCEDDKEGQEISRGHYFFFALPTVVRRRLLVFMNTAAFACLFATEMFGLA